MYPVNSTVGSDHQTKVFPEIFYVGGVTSALLKPNVHTVTQ